MGGNHLMTGKDSGEDPQHTGNKPDRKLQGLDIDQDTPVIGSKVAGLGDPPGGSAWGADYDGVLSRRGLESVSQGPVPYGDGDGDAQKRPAMQIQQSISLIQVSP